MKTSAKKETSFLLLCLADAIATGPSNIIESKLRYQIMAITDNIGGRVLDAAELVCLCRRSSCRLSRSLCRNQMISLIQ